MRLLVLNDIHIGVTRSAGTTPTTAWQLRQDILSKFDELVSMATGECDLLINGDLFDSYTVPYNDLLKCFNILSDYIRQSPSTTTLWLSAGNHDLSTNSTKLSSFEFLADLLKTLYPLRVQVIKGSKQMPDGGYIISHVPNQDLFNMELQSVPDGTKYLFLHCNYDNHFAQEADHSLNLSADQAAALASRGIKIILGHEHQYRFEPLGGGFVMCLGNQIPSSVADCLNNKDKRALMIMDEGMEEVVVWNADEDYAQVDWRDLPTYAGSARFIRVAGSAQASEAAEVVSVISKFRNKSEAAVVANAVRLETEDGSVEFEALAQQVKSFDVLQALLEVLSPEEQAVVKSVLEADPNV